MSDNEGWTTVTYKKVKKPPKQTTPLPVNKLTAVLPTNKFMERRESTGLHKIENETETFIVKKFGDLGKKIAVARSAKGMTQKDLALKLFLGTNIIQNIENGSAVYDGKIVHKLKTILDIK